MRYVLVALVLLVAGCNFLWQQGNRTDLSGDVENLFQEYGVRIPKPECQMVETSRAAFCKFKMDNLGALLIALDQAGAQPKTANQWGQLNRTTGGSPECVKTLKKALAPRVQRGGERLPYLIGIYYDEPTGLVCADVEYGYG